MTSKEFIIQELNKLTKVIPDVKCSYKFDDCFAFHNIEILPSDVFNNSEELTNKQFNIMSAFYEQFPDEQIAFFTEGDLIEITSPDFVVNGSKYGQNLSEKLSWLDFLSTSPIKFDAGIKGVDGKVEPNNNYALAA